MMNDLSIYLFPLLLTLLAGLSTGIGGLMSFFSKSFNPRFLSVALGFSAGVMIYVSFVEIIPKANASLSAIFGEHRGYLFTTLGFFGGIAVIGLIDLLIPSNLNPHEIRQDVSDLDHPGMDSHLLRMGVFTALAIGIHNFPEGLATFLAALEDPNLGISIAIAIAIHNIPEGIAIAVPMYYATKSQTKALGFTLIAGISEPLGAIVGYSVLLGIFSEATFGVVFSAVAGVMVYVSLDELLPAAEKYGEHHIAILGVTLGMVVMATSLLLLYG